MPTILHPNQPVPLVIGDPVYLPMYSGVKAGFPSPAEDFELKRLDLNEMLIKHPQATFLMRVGGRSQEGVRIFEDDILVVDRALQAQHSNIVIACIDGEFTCKTLYRRNGEIKLEASNPEFSEIKFREGQTMEVWGVVTAAIRVFL